jgi:riboflavin biosynthesis pyrimidine reductase
MPAVRLSRPYCTTELLERVVQSREQAIAAGLVDEYQMFVVTAVVDGGTRALPDQVRLNLALAEERRFGSGTVCLCYRPA